MNLCVKSCACALQSPFHCADDGGLVELSSMLGPCAIVTLPLKDTRLVTGAQHLELSRRCGACRTPTRDRLKLIPRVVNVEQWAVDAPLSAAEYRLTRSYNDKPLLTRPQHKVRPLARQANVVQPQHNVGLVRLLMPVSAMVALEGNCVGCPWECRLVFALGSTGCGLVSGHRVRHSSVSLGSNTSVSKGWHHLLSC